ncbi:uncharacterized protein LOC131036397 isoform X2 [Cryptomeria japonica]|uniref:uncharacterized protein LOC131036397 isoform X2 n=1 Tax=Cryptomeria japonica TaxID=3369 RepID=UPI0027DA4AFE|nr:uncharacterized protein LOC131036397 isoform X2 [Cryptomeria japonica]
MLLRLHAEEMGIIKDGSVSGVLPDINYFAVNYPGYPSSIPRAIETLGGIDGIAKARSSDANYIELRFRPEDPHSHPAFGELRQNNCLLLRITRKTTHDGQSSVSQATFPSEMNENSLQSIDIDHDIRIPGSENFVLGSSNELDTSDNDEIDTSPAQDSTKEELRADIVARVDHAYSFDGMVDYQYVLAVHAETSRNKKKGHIDPGFEKGTLMDIEQDDLMMLVPPLFSLKDMPEQLVLKPSNIVKAKQKQEKIMQQQWEMDITPCFGLDFKIEEVPQKINWEDKIVKGSNDWILQTAVSKLFDERPIWPKRTLQERLADDGLKITYDHLKRLLFRTAYYFGCGPYRTLWIRNGYDARKDPESRIYQRVDFRIPKPLRDSINANSKEGEKVLWKDICAFRVVPHKKFSSLQLYDLQDDYIQEQIRKPPERTTCRQSTGWFSRSTFDRLRLHVRVRFLSLLSSDAARTLVLSESRILERYKRRAGYEETRHESDSDGLEHVDRSSISADATNLAQNENHERHPHHEDEDEKDEGDDDEGEEEEEEEEEMDDYDYPPPERFGSASPGRDSYMDFQDNIPRNYLQLLLGKFPFSEVGEHDPTQSKPGGTDLSDGEYAIQEQDSDDDDY